uniref:Uncharacterized protein n=1 Tax=Oryza nivara TaxID=4536 RepID=A0A0E0FXM1_ORYNI
MQLRERMARTSWESLTLTAAGVAATGEDLGDAATVLLPGANDIPDRRRDVDIVRGSEAAKEERQRVASAKTQLMTRSLRMEMGALSVEAETEGSLLRETAALRAQAEGVVEEGRRGWGEEGGDETWRQLASSAGERWMTTLCTGPHVGCIKKKGVEA